MNLSQNNTFPKCIKVILLASLGLSFSASAETISIDEMVIEGTIQKPEAFFILPRASLSLDDLDRRADLKRRIINAVKNSPF